MIHTGARVSSDATRQLHLCACEQDNRLAASCFARPRTDCVSILRLLSMLMAVQGLKHFDAANVLETVQYDVAHLQYRADR